MIGGGPHMYLPLLKSQSSGKGRYIMWCNQTEWLRSRYRHVAGFRSFISLRYMSMYILKSNLSLIYNNWCYIDLTNKLCKPKYCIEVHKFLVSNNIDPCSKYTNNLKPVACRYRLWNDSAWSQYCDESKMGCFRMQLCKWIISSRVLL